MLHPVIPSGGSGSRLWPLSHQNQPKQFLALVGERSLFQGTLRRAVTLPDVHAPVVFCAEDDRFMVGEQIQELGATGAGILLGPIARNTASAIALAALHMAASDPDVLMLVLPADQLIEDEDAFRGAVIHALALAKAGWLVTFGVTPDGPETGYSYIAIGDQLKQDGCRVARFVEKPGPGHRVGVRRRRRLCVEPGMFLLSARRYLEVLQASAPAMHATAQAYAIAYRDLTSCGSTAPRSRPARTTRSTTQ